MSKLVGFKYYRVASNFLVAVLPLLLWVMKPQAVFAHPLDVYLQATYLSVKPTQIEVELDLTPGVLVAPQILPQLDTNGDGQISDAEGRAYVDSVLGKVLLQVDAKPLTLGINRIEMPEHLNLQAGYGTIRVFATAQLSEAMSGTHQLTYKNNYSSVGSAYQVNAFIDKKVAVTLGKQNRDSLQQGMTMSYTLGSAVPTTTVSSGGATISTTAVTSNSASLALPFEVAAGSLGQAKQLLTYLYEPAKSPWVLFWALALALVLGGLHALTPGHGKTLVAAYLVGSRGTVKHAVFLGGIVTFTHTASVIVIGLLALFASRFVMPNVLMPILETLSGLLVVYMGARLIGQRWHVFRSNPSHAHGRSHEHAHTHDHEMGAAHHHGDGHIHTHLPPVEGINLSNLLAMGVSGGLVPCPEALGIMVIAIGLNRILLGLGLIVSFSFGLAAVLIAIGILLVRSRSLVERFGGMSGRWSSALPFASAMIVTLLGIGMTLSGLATYWR